MKTYEIVGWKGDADLWCPACAHLAFDRRVDGVLRVVGDEREAFAAVDNEGNPVAPVFADQAGDSACGGCGERLLD